MRHGAQLRLRQQPFARDARQHGPADLPDAIRFRLRDQRRVVLVAVPFQNGRHAGVHDTEDRLQPLAIRRHRLGVRLRRRKIPLPECLTPLDQVRRPLVQQPMRLVHQADVEIFSRFELYRARQDRRSLLLRRRELAPGQQCRNENGLQEHGRHETSLPGGANCRPKFECALKSRNWGWCKPAGSCEVALIFQRPLETTGISCDSAW